MVGNSNDETNFPHKSLLTDKQVSKIRKASANCSSANIKFSKTQLSNMTQVREFLFSLPYKLASEEIGEQIIKQ